MVAGVFWFVIVMCGPGCPGFLVGHKRQKVLVRNLPPNALIKDRKKLRRASDKLEATNSPVWPLIKHHRDTLIGKIILSEESLRGTDWEFTRYPFKLIGQSAPASSLGLKGVSPFSAMKGMDVLPLDPNGHGNVKLTPSIELFVLSDTAYLSFRNRSQIMPFVQDEKLQIHCNPATWKEFAKLVGSALASPLRNTKITLL